MNKRILTAALLSALAIAAGTATETETETVDAPKIWKIQGNHRGAELYWVTTQDQIEAFQVDRYLYTQQGNQHQFERTYTVGVPRLSHSYVVSSKLYYWSWADTNLTAGVDYAYQIKTKTLNSDSPFSNRLIFLQKGPAAR